MSRAYREFIAACRANDMASVMQLSRTPHTPETVATAFMIACRNNNLDLAQWLHGLGGVDIRADKDCEFNYACYHNHLNVAKWLWSVDNAITSTCADNDTFGHVCLYGCADVAHWLYDLGGVSSTEASHAFVMACWEGHLSIAKWLIGLKDADICFDKSTAFSYACSKGCLETARWLVGLGGVDIHADNDDALRLAICNDHLETAQYLISLDFWGTYPWPEYGIEQLQTFSPARDAWMSAVVRTSTRSRNVMHGPK